jgi:hypothetical protein
MTFKDLKKRVSLESITQQQSKLTEKLHNKPFWIWNIDQHKQEDINKNGDCCFNHIIGFLPKMDRKKQCLIMKSYCTNAFNNLLVCNAIL